jgi:hypothetical protein
MVGEDAPSPRQFLLAPLPLQLHEREYGLADDLPPTVVHVDLPPDETGPVTFTPGWLLLTGTLELGPREEANGRVSSIRLRLDPRPAPGAAPAAAPPPLSTSTGLPNGKTR